MTIKERIIDELRRVNFGNDFLNEVGEKWIDEMEDNDEEYILNEIKDVINYGAANGGVSFVIYTADNKAFIKENLDDMFEFLQHYEYAYDTKLEEVDADTIMCAAVEMCASIIESEISLSLESYEEEEELTEPEIVEIFQEVRENTL